MKLPIYSIMGDRPVMAVRTEDGGLEVLAFDWATGQFVPSYDYLARITLDPGPDGDIVTKEEFDAHVAALREEMKDGE